jgi:hypothetical protein
MSGKNSQNLLDFGSVKHKYYTMTNKSIRDYINLIENAQSEVVTSSPLVRHIEKELTAIGYKKGTPEFDAYFKDAMAYYRQHGNFGNADTQGLGEEVAEGWTKLPSGDYQNSHTGVRSSKPPVKKKRGEKTGAEWDAIEKAKKDKEQGVAEEQLEETTPDAVAKVEQLFRHK